MLVLISLFCVEFLCCLRLMCVLKDRSFILFHILVEFGKLSGRLLGKQFLTRLTICFLSIKP